jgi:uncharacterized SAM-binding protein YcdF (DUF218 family)
MNIIIVLGRKLNSEGYPSDILLKRMEDAVSWYKIISGSDSDKETVLLLSGGAGPDGYSRYYSFSKTKEASVMKRIAVKLGVPSKNILLENSSKDTIENAKFTKNILDSLFEDDYNELYLVTSDFHMKRALCIFRDIVDEDIYSLVSKYDPFFEKSKEVCELKKYKKSKYSRKSKK